MLFNTSLYSGSDDFSLTLSPDDRKDLECLFLYLFTETTAGYTIHGSKPIFIDGLKLDGNEALSTSSRACDLLKKAKLKNKKIQICITESLSNPDHKEIRLINKKALLRTIKKNLHFFQSELNTTQDAQKILDEILSSRSFDFFRGHVALQGIVLGYGTQNALAYEKANKLMAEVEKKGILDEFLQSEKKIVDVENEIKEAVIAYGKSNDEKWGEILGDFRKFTYFDESDMKANFNVKIPFSYISDSKESKELIKKYIKTEKKVLKLSKNKHFVQKTLEKLD